MYAEVIFYFKDIFHSNFLSKVMFVPISLFKKQIWNHLDHFKNLDHLVIVFYLRWKNNHICRNVLRVAYSCQQSKKKNMLFINQGWIYLGQIYIFWMKKTRAGVNLFRHTSFNMYMHYVPQFINKILHFKAKKKLHKNDPKYRTKIHILPHINSIV